MNKSPIFILGLHKSATTLLRNLLDGHPELFVIPFETHFFQLSNFWVDYEYRRARPKPSASQADAVANFIRFVKKISTTSDAFGDAFIKGKIDPKKFEHLLTPPADTCTSLLISQYFESIAQSITDTTYQKSHRLVEKSVEHAEFTLELQQLFPDAKFVRILRNPYSNIVSLRKFQTNNYTFPLMHRVLATMENSYWNLYKNKFLLSSDNYKMIRYEDLVSEPEQIMTDVADFLDISFEPSLLTPTLLGKSWKGNSMSGKKFKGISSARLKQWKKEIQPMEIYYINKLFPFLLEDFGYERISTNGVFLKPAPKENPARYVINRLYRFYLRHI